MAQARRVGVINVGVFAQTRKFQKSIGKARKTLRSFTGFVKRAVFNLKTLGVALATGAFAKFTMDAARSIDSLAKTSDKLGITTEALAGLRLAATETGVEVRQLDMGLQRMIRRVSEAAQDTGEAKAALKELGVDAKALVQLSPDQQFREIARAMANVKNQADRVRLSFKLFDSEGVALVNTLKLGDEGLREAASAAQQLGIAVDRETARGVERAIDAWGRFRSAISGVMNQIAIQVAPILEFVSKRMTQFLSVDAQKFGQGVGQFAIGVFKSIGDGFQVAIGLFVNMINLAARVINSLAPSLLSIAQRWMGVSDQQAGQISMQLGSFTAQTFQAKRMFERLPQFSAFIEKGQRIGAGTQSRQANRDPMRERREMAIKTIAQESRMAEKKNLEQSKKQNDWLQQIARNTAGAVGGTFAMTDLGAP